MVWEYKKLMVGKKIPGEARYDDVIAGHEPGGQVAEVGEGALDFNTPEP